MRRSFLILFSMVYISLQGQEYQCHLDLTNVVEDRVRVEVEFIDFDLLGNTVYNMPMMVPGTYHKSNYGRLLHDFKAYDTLGIEIDVVKVDTNRWLIENGASLGKVVYWVDDSFDDPRFSDIFEPAGTNIEENNFLINTFGFVGFLDNMEKYAYKVHVTYPDHLYGVSPMERVTLSDTEEVFSAENYLQLSDSPIMYSPPDTSSVMVDDTYVVVSVYSPTKDSIAPIMMESVKPTLEAIGKYLGGNLPVKRYAVLIYLHENPTNSGLMGALEHSYSTVFSYPDLSPQRLARSIVDVCSHEFFHIITPLTIHSEEIGNYDFVNAKMSKHLWLYEGVTEYSSMRVQVMYDLITVDQYLDDILRKLKRSQHYNDSLSFTEMSLGALDKYEDQYGNVYSKGALIGMSLDLLLLNLSEGSYDIRKLMEDLGEKYGVDKSFRDEELFEVIAELTYPETRNFFKEYVEGGEALPLKEYLSFAGAEYLEGETIYKNTLGEVSFGYDPELNTLVVVDNSKMNQFGKEIGYKVGDVLMSINERKVSFENYQEVMDDFNKLNEGEKVVIKVIRYNKRNKGKIKKLKSTVQKGPMELKTRIEWLEDPSEKQLKVRSAWLNKDKELKPVN